MTIPPWSGYDPGSMRPKIIQPVTALILGAVLISFSSVFVRAAQVPSSVSAFYRVAFGSVFLVLACVIKKEFKPRSLKNNLLAVLCGFVFAMDLLAWHLSIHYIGPGVATILANCQVFVLTLAGFFLFKEKIRWVFVISLPMAFFGLFLIVGVDMERLTPNQIMGVWFGLATAFFYSIFLLLLRRIQSDKDDFSLFYYLMVVSVVTSLFLGGKIHLSGESFAIPDLTSLIWLVCLGLFNQTIAWVMISNALPRVNASYAGLILLLQPTLSFVWDIIFFARPTGVTGWVGAAIVVWAIYLGMTGKK